MIQALGVNGFAFVVMAVVVIPPLIAIALAKAPMRRPSFWGVVGATVAAQFAAFLLFGAFGGDRGAVDAPSNAPLILLGLLAVTTLAGVVALFYVSARRFIDLGGSKWWALTLFPTVVFTFGVGPIVWVIVLGSLRSAGDGDLRNPEHAF